MYTNPESLCQAPEHPHPQQHLWSSAQLFWTMASQPHLHLHQAWWYSNRTRQERAARVLSSRDSALWQWIFLKYLRNIQSSVTLTLKTDHLKGAYIGPSVTIVWEELSVVKTEWGVCIYVVRNVIYDSNFLKVDMKHFHGWHSSSTNMSFLTVLFVGQRLF